MRGEFFDLYEGRFLQIKPLECNVYWTWWPTQGRTAGNTMTHYMIMPEIFLLMEVRRSSKVSTKMLCVEVYVVVFK